MGGAPFDTTAPRSRAGAAGRFPPAPQAAGRDVARAGTVRPHNARQVAILLQIAAMIALLDRRVADMDRQSAAPIAPGPPPAGQARLLSAVPGIGGAFSPRSSARCRDPARAVAAGSRRSPASPRIRAGTGG
jgi:hypothetical protein